jgi:hypothetical protein
VPVKPDGSAVAVALAVALVLSGTAAGAVATVPASGDVSVQTNSGLTVTVQGVSEFPTQPFADDQTIQLQSGTVAAPGTSNVRLPQGTLNGSETRLDKISASGTTITVGPGDKPQFAVGGDIERINMTDDVAADDGQPDFEYGGASGTSFVRVRGLPASVTLKAVDADTGALLDATTTTTGGVATFDELDNSNHTVVLTTGNTPPTVDTAAPDGTVSALPTTLTADIDDADFRTGESVDVTISVNGQQQTATTITSAQEVSYTVNQNEIPNGTNTWTVNATDAAGESTVRTFNVDVPGKFRVYNESAPDTLVSASGNVTFFTPDGDEVETRDLSGGTVSLRGLDVSEYSAVIEADGYRRTTYYIEDIAGNESAYILPSNQTTSEIIFELDDSTGRFPAEETTLKVQRARNISGSTTYTTVVSDRFDATGEVPAEIVNDERYRLIVRNAENQSRILGSYTPTADARVVLPIGTVRLAGDTEEQTAFSARLGETASGRVIRLQYRDPQQRTDELRITVVEYGNRSNVLIDNQTISGPFGEATVTYDVPANASADIAYRVQYEAIRSGGEDRSGEAIVGNVPPVAQSLGLAPNVLSLLGWATIILTTGLMTIASAQLATVVAVFSATLMTLIGAVTIPFALLGVAGAIAFLTNFGRLTQ